MLDVRVDTFLSVYKHKSFTKAASELCITQPAVTQHIKALETRFSSKLFEYSNRELKITKAGELFYKYALDAKLGEKIVNDKISNLDKKSKAIKFAATLTIGEFTMAPLLGDLVKEFSAYDITMLVDNTEKVLNMLQQGDISFALVEGFFNKANYQSRLLKNSNFIPIASKDHPLVCKKLVEVKDILVETIIVREKGSGSREILERNLYDKGYTLNDFNSVIEIGNVNVIKEMAKSNLGLSFMYKDAALKEIENGELGEVKIKDFVIQREFNFLYIENEILKGEIDMFYHYVKSKILS